MQEERRTFARAGFVIAIGIMATTLPQMKVLASIPLLNLLKNELGLDRTATAGFIFVIGFAWYLKPLFGALTDAYPLFGSRRRSYMLIGSVLVVAGWLTAGQVPHAFGPLLAALTFTCTAMVVVSCATGGLLVETAQAAGAAGRLASLRQAVASGCFIVAAPVSGYLAKVSFGWTALAAAAVAASLIPVTVFLLKEPHHPPQPLRAVAAQLGVIARARRMWAATGLMLLFYCAPGTTTALFYRQQNVLGMSTETQGWLTFCTYVAAIAAAAVYAKACRRLELRTLLMAGIAAAAISGSGYALYDSVPAAFVIDTVEGFGYTLAELAFLDLATRVTPRGSESLGYSLMLSARNLAIYGTDIVGSRLMDHHGWHFEALVAVNVATTLLALPCVLLMPRDLLDGRDQ